MYQPWPLDRPNLPGRREFWQLMPNTDRTLCRRRLERHYIDGRMMFERARSTSPPCVWRTQNLEQLCFRE
jgi:hypothetical protein